MSKPLRVTMLAPFALAPKATTQARVVPLARALAARGHEVQVLIPPYDNPLGSGRIEVVDGVRLETLRVDASVPEQSPRQALLQPGLALDLARRALQFSPDVLHVFKPKAVSGLAQMALWYGLLRARRPALVLDTDDWEGNGGWNEYETYPWWQKWAIDFQERWGLGHADAVTVASRTLATQAWSHGVQPRQTVYLPNGLDLSRFAGWAATGATDVAEARGRMGLRDRPVIVLYTRFFEFGPERPVEVLARVQERVADALLLVVGAGKFGQERRLLELAKARGLERSVVLAGWTPPVQLPALLACGDVAIVPSDDNLANRAKCSVKLLELLWLRRPVVADRVGQLAEYVVHGQCGLLSEPGQPESMAGMVAELLLDPTQAARLGAAGRDRVAAEFTWDHLAPRLEAAYQVAQELRASHRGLRL